MQQIPDQDLLLAMFHVPQARWMPEYRQRVHFIYSFSPLCLHVVTERFSPEFCPDYPLLHPLD